MTFRCEYCKKTFKRENSLAVHMCQKKRRHLTKDNKEVMAGFNAYNVWNKRAMGSRVDKTYDEFAKSNYYNAFVRFGSYLVDARVLNAEKYIDWLVLNRAKLDDWCKDRIYNQYLKEFTKKETAQRALERFVLFADEWATKNEKHWTEFWEAPPHEIVHYIQMGKISPWILYCSDKAQSFIDTLPDQMLVQIADTMDPQYWQRKTKMFPDDVKMIKEFIE